MNSCLVINQDRENFDKKPFDNNPSKEKIVNQSTTDLESGVPHRGEHRICFAYAAHTACDKNGYVLDVTLNHGNVHDNVAFDVLHALQSFSRNETYCCRCRVQNTLKCKMNY